MFAQYGARSAINARAGLHGDRAVGGFVRTRGRHALAVHSGDFFSTLKIERCHRRRHISRNEARADIFD